MVIKKTKDKGKMSYGIQNEKILVIHRKLAALNMLENVLKQAGFSQVYTATNKELALELGKKVQFKLVIMDLCQPYKESYEICKKIKRLSNASVLFMLSKTDKVNMQFPYFAGGEDFIYKPFAKNEFIKKTKVLLQHETIKTKLENNKSFCIKEFTIDISKKLVKKGECVIPFTNKELRIFQLLMQSYNCPVSKNDIIKELWGDEVINYENCANSLMVHIRHMRKKIEVDPDHPKYLMTVKGEGYYLDLEGDGNLDEESTRKSG